MTRTPALTQTLLALGQYDRAPDQQALTERIGIFLHKYESMPTNSCRS